MSIRILLADDHKIIRDGLRALIEQQADMEVVSEAEDGHSAVQQARELKPDLVIMDVGMSILNGIEATRQIRRELSQIKVIALSMHSDRRFVLGMLRAGAQGYLLKDCAFDELARAIQSVMRHQTYLSPAITGVVVEDYLMSTAEEPLADELSVREREVLQLLAEGYPTKQIASSLQISVKTVESHRQNIMRKLDLHSIAQLTKYAMRSGLTFDQQ